MTEYIARRIEKTYTGGGTYAYKGQLTSGEYFIGDEYPEIVKANVFNASWDEITSVEWYEENAIGKMLDTPLSELWETAIEREEN